MAYQYLASYCAMHFEISLPKQEIFFYQQTFVMAQNKAQSAKIQ